MERKKEDLQPLFQCLPHSKAPHHFLHGNHWEVKTDTAEGVQILCHRKWLGDLPIGTVKMDIEQWEKQCCNEIQVVGTWKVWTEATTLVLQEVSLQEGYAWEARVPLLMLEMVVERTAWAQDTLELLG